MSGARRLALLAAVLAPCALLGAAGLLLAPVVALAGRRALLAGSPGPRPAADADTALLLDLVAAGMQAGAGVPAALVAAAVAVPAHSRACGRVAALLLAGLPPDADQAQEPAVIALVRVLERCTAGGVAPVAMLRRAAEDLRVQARDDGAERARRVGVRVVAPLALCFLPAFALVAVVPVAIGLARTG